MHTAEEIRGNIRYSLLFCDGNSAEVFQITLIIVKCTREAQSILLIGKLP